MALYGALVPVAIFTRTRQNFEGALGQRLLARGARVTLCQSASTHKRSYLCVGELHLGQRRGLCVSIWRLAEAERIPAHALDDLLGAEQLDQRGAFNGRDS